MDAKEIHPHSAPAPRPSAARLIRSTIRHASRSRLGCRDTGHHEAPSMGPGDDAAAGCADRRSARATSPTSTPRWSATRSPCLFATFGLTYRYAMWLQRPPTAMYWRRGWQTFFRPRLPRRNLVQPGCSRVGATSLANRFIWRARTGCAGCTHLLIMWGCLLAVAITFPLVFGWIHFRAACPATSTRIASSSSASRPFRVPASSRSSASSSFTAWSGRRSWSSPA